MNIGPNFPTNPLYVFSILGRVCRTVLIVCILASLTLIGSSNPSSASSGVYRIMPLGDSITRGVGQDFCNPASNPSGCISYRKRLRDHLVSGAQPSGFRWKWVGSLADEPIAGYRHEGHGGWTIEKIDSMIDTWIPAANPDVILLHIGTNNITQSDTPQEASDKLTTLLSHIRQLDATVQVFVGRIIDINTSLPDEQELRNRQFANLVGNVVTSMNDSRMYVVDFRDIGGESLFDNRHPNEFGYTKMAYRWYQAMRGRVKGSNLWTNVSNPYTWSRYNICHYTTTKVCAVQPVNDGRG